MRSQKLKPRKLISVNFIALIIIGLSIILAAISANFSGSSVSNCPAGNYNCQRLGISLAANGCGSDGTIGNNPTTDHITTSINFDCQGNNCPPNPVSNTFKGSKYCLAPHNGIIDLLFAIIRFLTDGVGLIIILSVIIGGIQYITSRGDPKGTQAAAKRLTSTGVALAIFVFAYAILNYVIPAGFLQ